ncbi:restriction endonuclease subunit S [Staphylococcus equorum]|uniref:restriction endonuclease subunit S n=1 Tax=Staphylococcus equorum TaxID=246432 RepID=UPI00085318C9|nr:restriction endonuclease subunit S [Staphylococcus equorum]MDK9864050.1 restriction endonuclease subunit S [Staphylococcus equorum]
MVFKNMELGQIASITKLAGYEFTKDIQYIDNGEIIAIRALNVKNGKLDLSQTKRISKDVSNKLVRSKLFKNEIVLTYTGSKYGEVALVKENDKFHLAPNVCKITVNDNNITPYYVLLIMQTSDFKMQLKNYGVGSSQPTIPMKNIRKLQVAIPSISYQKEVLRIIEPINKKLELNQEIIANLEELSQTLFKRWFVDFEFPDENGNPYKSNGGEMVDSELGAIPKGWNVKNLDDIANYMNGLAMQKFKPTDNQNSLPVVKIKELKNGSTDENSNRCTSEIPEKALIVDGDIIFSWSATLLVKMWCGGKAGLNQHLFKVSSDKYPKWFYYYWTKRYIDYFIGIANDKATTMGHINRKHLSHAKILIPNDQTLERFSRTFDDLLEKELSVSKESKRLTELRDTLLPKLMSGEIEIPTDIEVNEDELSI